MISASTTRSQIGKRRTRTFCVSSGKGGVGKSTLVANLALQLGQQGQRVLIFDGDLGMANIDIMFGQRMRHSIAHVLSGEKTMAEIMCEVCENVTLIPGGSGIDGLQNMSYFQKKSLLDQVSEFNGNFDWMIIDTASGIDENVLYLNSAAQESYIVVTPEPASITDAYALMKILHQRFNERRFSILANMVQDEKEALQIYQRLSDVSQKFLCVGLDYKGFVPLDTNLRLATKAQQLIVQTQPRSPSSHAIRMLSEKVSGYGPLVPAKGGLQFFWEQLVGVA